MTPTVGRIVHFWNYATHRGEQPEAAIVTKVNPDSVNLTVFSATGTPYPATEITLWDGEGEAPEQYAEWPKSAPPAGAPESTDVT